MVLFFNQGMEEMNQHGQAAAVPVVDFTRLSLPNDDTNFSNLSHIIRKFNPSYPTSLFPHSDANNYDKDNNRPPPPTSKPNPNPISLFAAAGLASKSNSGAALSTPTGENNMLITCHNYIADTIV